MNTNRDNFSTWYSQILERLYLDQNAGFAILMITFPLLERYLREKSGVHENDLNDTFYTELQRIFPVLIKKDMARQFWQVYRHGLLHQVTLSLKNKKGIQMPAGWLHQDVDLLKIDDGGNFWVHPSKFAKKVIEVIESDFDVFEGQHSVNHPLPRVHPITLGTSTIDLK